MNKIRFNSYNGMFLSLTQENSSAGKSIAKPLFLFSLFDCIALFLLLRENWMTNYGS